MDLFVCGRCSTVFRDLDNFLIHKQSSTCTESDCQQVPVIYPATTVVSTTDIKTSAVHATVIGAGGESTTYVIIQNNSCNEGQGQVVDNRPGAVTLLPSSSVNCQTEQQGKGVQLVEVQSPVSARLWPACQNVRLRTLNTEGSLMSSIEVHGGKIVKKRGRPRKCPPEATVKGSSEVQNSGAPTLNSHSTAGSDCFDCVNCHQSFGQSQHLLSHRCLVPTSSLDTDVKPTNMKSTGVHSYSLDSKHNDGLLSAIQSVPEVNKPTEVHHVGNWPKSAENKRSELPLFSKEDDRIAFERCLGVDIEPHVAGMFSAIGIEQGDIQLAGAAPSHQLTVYSCHVCKKVFKSLSHVRLHCLVHTEARPFRCPWCSYETNTRGNLYTHVRRHTGMVYRCDQCEFTSTNQSHLAEHEQTHSTSRHVCDLCHHDYSTVKSLMNHIRKYHAHTTAGANYLAKFKSRKCQDRSALLHQCNICNWKFKRRVDCDRHLLLHHAEEAKASPECLGLTVCELCGEAHSRSDYLQRHLSKHRIIYSCAICSSRFASSSRLNRHLQEKHEGETDDEQFWRSIDRSFFLPEPDGSMDLWMNTGSSTTADDLAIMNGNTDSGESMIGTTKNMEASAAPSNLTSSGETDSAEAQFLMLGYRKMNREIFSQLQQAFGGEECEFCGRLFFMKNALIVHVRRHTGEKPFSCDQCQYSSSTRQSLRRHIAQEHEHLCYVCYVCGAALASRGLLLFHHRKTHGIQPQYMCTACNLTFTGIKRLHIHLQMSHSELTAADIKRQLATLKKHRGKIGHSIRSCPHCARPFQNSSDLRQHIWMHEGIKPFRCTSCSYACRSRSNLIAHQLRHSSARPFLCNICGKPYKSRTALRWHERSHANGCMFKCDRCPYEAVQLSHLHRHVETHILARRYACDLCDYSSNTASYLKIHKTRRHALNSPNVSSLLIDRVVEDPSSSIASGLSLQCVACEYCFGNRSDWKRHLRTRHGIDADHISSMNSAGDALPNLQHGYEGIESVGANTVFTETEISGIVSSENTDASSYTTTVMINGSRLPTIDHSDLLQDISVPSHLVGVDQNGEIVLLNPLETYSGQHFGDASISYIEPINDEVDQTASLQLHTTDIETNACY